MEVKTKLFVEQPLELEFHLLRGGAALMFDIDNGSGWYGNTLPCHLNLKPLPLLDAVSQPPQFFDELFHRVILLDVTFTSFLLRYHLRPPLIPDLIIPSEWRLREHEPKMRKIFTLARILSVFLLQEYALYFCLNNKSQIRAKQKNIHQTHEKPKFHVRILNSLYQ